VLASHTIGLIYHDTTLALHGDLCRIVVKSNQFNSVSVLVVEPKNPVATLHKNVPVLDVLATS
jgi:hypothetical protein